MTGMFKSRNTTSPLPSPIHRISVVNDDVAEKRVVEVGLEEDEQLEIVSGIEAGEQIVVAGQGSLKDGSKIKVLEPDESTQAANVETPGQPKRG